MSILQLVDLSCGYGGNPLLSEVNLTLEPGESVTMVGPNGAGKSTLLRTISGALAPCSGDIFLGNTSLWGMKPDQRAKKISMLMQMQPLDPGFTVEELVGLGRTPYLGRFGHYTKEDQRAISDAIEVCDLRDLKKKPLGHLSGGERQRVRLGMVLAQQTDLLLLDEPTNHLDVNHRYMLYKIIVRIRKERGCGVIMVSHSLEDSQRFGERTLLVNEGKVQIFCKDSFTKLKETIVTSANVPGEWVY